MKQRKWPLVHGSYRPESKSFVSCLIRAFDKTQTLGSAIDPTSADHRALLTRFCESCFAGRRRSLVY